MILTDEEVIKLWDSHTVPVFGKSGINPIVFAQLVESAVLEKLKAQDRLKPAPALTDKHDIDYLKQVFSYDPETGEITWKIRRGNMIVGTIAGSVWGDGYRYIRFDGTLYLAHRIAFAMYHGRYPEAVDHINMVRDDNRISNLREATVAENNRNKRIQSNNSSGYKGVTLHKPSGKFQAKIMFDGKTESLGYFDTKEDAAIAYENAARKLNGEFYCQTLPLPPDDVVRDAERLDWIQANCRCDPMMDGQHKWWPTNFNKCLTGPSIREAIDAAMKEMK